MKNLKLKIRTIKTIKLNNDKFHHPEYKTIIRYDHKKIRANVGYKRELNYDNF